VNETDPDGRTALMWAAQWTTGDIVELLIVKGAKVNARTQQGYTALMFALCVSRADNVRVLLRHGERVNVTNDRGETPLRMAMEAYGSERDMIVRMLRDAGATK
jgi:uncharacterized protein